MEISVAEYVLQTSSRRGRSRRAAGTREAEAPAPMRVLHVAAELYPWVKTGGLGDVMAALPPALAALGTDMRLVLPGFTAFLDAFELTEIAQAAHAVRGRAGADRAGAAAGQRGRRVSRRSSGLLRPAGHAVSGARRDGLARQPPALRAAGLGGGGAGARRRPGMAARSAALPRLARRPRPGLSAGAGRRDAERLHRAQHRVSGIFPGVVLRRSGACRRAFSRSDGVEFYGGLAFIKAGLFYADRLTTVSPTYAREIQTPAFGWGLDGLLRTRAGDLTGILNGVDPADLVAGERPASAGSVFGRRRRPCRQGGREGGARAPLRPRSTDGADDGGPLFGAVTRLTPQKGLDLLLAALPGLIDAGGRLVLLGSGDAALEAGFRAAERTYPGKVGVEIGYDEALSHLIIGGSDSILVPSRFEPCGLTQLYALRYGSPPVVRRTGGLADTVVDATAATLADGTATGFAFDDETPEGLLGALRRADRALRRPRRAGGG